MVSASKSELRISKIGIFGLCGKKWSRQILCCAYNAEYGPMDNALREKENTSALAESFVDERCKMMTRRSQIDIFEKIEW